jgi:hypothetical protein
MGYSEIAIAAGNYLCKTIKNQPHVETHFYLRFDKKDAPITDFPKDKALFYAIDKIEPMQLHFMMGYPSAYLAMLYKITNEKRFLLAAKEYLDFSLSCDNSVFKCSFSHKIAWAASIIWSITKEEKYLIAIDKIVNYFISTQCDNGIWYEGSDIDTQYDQSSEIACWFFSIESVHLSVSA